MAVTHKKIRSLFLNMHFLVMIAWITALGFLLYDNRYHLFLKPQFGVLLYTSLFIFILFCISHFFNEPRQQGQNSLVKGMIALLPIVFIFCVHDNTLGGYALSKRVLAPPTIDQRAAPIRNGKETETADISISKLTRKWSRYKNSRVSIEGLFYEPAGINKEMAIVFRYLMTCCAADAMPVGIVIKKDDILEIKNDDWVKVTGVVREEKIDGNLVIFMDLEKIEKLVMPSKSKVYFYN